MTAAMSISQEVGRLDAAAPRDRAVIIASIRQHFTQHDTSSFSEKLIHQLLNVLYKIIVDEKTLLAKTANKSPVELRLSQTSQLIRDVLNETKYAYKYKVVRTFLSSMLHVLPARKDILLRPIASNYLRACADVLSCRPHIDHLELDLWLESVNFCALAIENFEAYTSAENGSTVNLEVVQLTDCLALLLVWHAADLTLEASETETVIVRCNRLVVTFFQRHPRENNAYVPMVAILGTLLRFSLGNSRDVAQDLAAAALDVLVQSWTTRSKDLAGQLMNLAEIVMPLALELALVDAVFCQSVASILSHLIWENTSANIHFNLDDMTFYHDSAGQLLWTPTRDDAPSQRKYRCLILAAKIAVVTENSVKKRQEANPPAAQGSPKRARLQSDLDLVTIGTLLCDGNRDSQLFALQMLSVQSPVTLSGEELRISPAQVIPLVSSDDRDIQAWASICTAVHLPAWLRSESCSVLDYKTLLRISLRSVYLKSTPGLCLLASQMIKQLKFENITLSMLSADASDLAEPSSITPATLDFVLIYAKVLEDSGISLRQTLVSSMSRWLISRLPREAQQSMFYNSLEGLLRLTTVIRQSKIESKLMDRFEMTLKGVFGEACSSLQEALAQRTLQSQPNFIFNLLSIALVAELAQVPFQMPTTITIALSLVLPSDLFAFFAVFNKAYSAVVDKDGHSVLPSRGPDMLHHNRVDLLAALFQQGLSFVHANLESFKAVADRHQVGDDDRIDSLSPCYVATTLLHAALLLERERVRQREPFAQSPLREFWQSRSQIFLLADLAKAMETVPITKRTDIACDLVAFTARHCLSNYQFERNASLHKHIIVLLGSSATLWMSDENEMYSKLAQKVFGWLVSICLTSNISAAETRIAMVNLMEKLLTLDNMLVTTDNEGDAQSTRTTLILRFKDRDARVGLATASACLVLFDHLEEDQFGSLYNDISEACVPLDNTLETLTVRLQTLHNIFFRCDSLQPVVLGHLIEMDQFPVLQSPLESCMINLAKYQKCSGQKLFATHSAALIFIWLGQDRPLLTFPFYLFGFPSFRIWFEQSEAEIVAQLVSQCRFDQLSGICLSFGLQEATLVRQYLRKILVYRTILKYANEDDCHGHLCSLLGMKGLPQDLYDGRMLTMLFRALRDVPRPNQKLLDMIDRTFERPVDQSYWKRVAIAWATELKFCPTVRNLGQAEYLTITIDQLFSALNEDAGLAFENLTKADMLHMLSDCIFDIAAVRRTTCITGLNRLRFLVVIAKPDHLSGYLSEFFMDALRHIQIPSALKSQVCCLYKLVISRVDGVVSISRRAVVQACLHLLIYCQEPIQASHNFVDWLAALPLSDSAAQSNPFEIICKFSKSSAERPDCELISLIEYVRGALIPADEGDAFQSKQQLIQLLAHQSSWYQQIATSDLDLKLLDFLGAKYQPINDHDAAFVGRLRARRCFLLSRSDDAPVDEQLDSERDILLRLEQTLSSSDSATVSVCHTVLAQLHTESLLPATLEDMSDLFRSDTNQQRLKHTSVPPQWSALLQMMPFDDWTLTFILRLEASLEKQAPLRSLRPLLLHSAAFRQVTLPIILLKVLRAADKLITAEVSDIFKHMCLDYTRYSKAIFKIWYDTLRLMRQSASSARSIKRSLINFDSILAAEAALHFGLLPDAMLLLHLNWSDGMTDDSSRTRLQLRAYQAIDEPDSFYAIKSDGTISAALLLAQHEQDGMEMLALGSALTSVGGSLRQIGESSSDPILRRALKNMDVFNASFLSRFSVDSSPTDEDFEAAWRLGVWDLPVRKASEQVTIGVHETIYQLHKHCQAVHLEQKELDTHLVASSYKNLLSGFDPRKSDPFLTMVLEVEELLSQNFHVAPSAFLAVWSERAATMTRPRCYINTETLLWSRQVMLNTVVKGAASTTVEELRVAQLRLLVHDYHRLPASHRLQPWTTAAACAEKVQSEARHVIPADLSSAVCAMISAVLWSHGNTSMSIETIRDVVELSKGSLKDQEDRARSNLDLGLRMASARLQAPQEILDNILTPAILEVEDLKSDRAGQMFNEYASFCYEQLTSTTISEDSERLYELCETQQKELNTLTSAVEQASAHMRGALQVKLKNVKVLFAQDQEELARLEKTRDQYLIQSLRFYLQSFGATDRHDDSIGRCCSLWFANSNKEDVNTAWATMWAKVPSHKYLQIVHQLLSRLTQDDTIFQRNLQQLLLWLAQDHPFHVLYPIYAIGSAHKKDSGTIARRAAALRLLQNIKARSSHLKALVTQTNACCAIYVKLARAESSRQASRFDWKDVPYGRDFIATMSKIDLPPLTQRIEPRASCDYTDLPRIAGFGPHVTIANGNSRPKILVCKLDDGTKNRELLKSGDDLRQDAVMQQVFLGVYAILQRNEDTRRRKLLIRTYHVLPLGDKVGVIQFVPGTKSFNDILPDLHNRYRSEDWDSKSCREKMKEAAERSRSHRYEAFNQIMERVKPVMRHIFVEWHASADRWFATQLAYTRSTAAMSILGWIIGLGDRHLSNIMLDQGTGDIVHIDLGICFEAGRLLKIPELVPFRLTRDVVDGMGIQGVEGVFKRCCTFTMAVLRKEQDSIKSILDILRYDPLYDWSVSSDKQKKQESAGSAIEETNGHTRGKPNKDQQTANWALLVVHQKLSKTLSATAMTNDLIQQATDPKRLAVIFCGWQPYY